jgi:hypothetical protein
MNPDINDLVRAIDAERHARRKVPAKRLEQTRVRRRLAAGLHRLALRIDG